MAVAAQAITLVDAVLPARRAVHNVVLVLVGTALIALSARAAIPLPFSPVPVTLQTFTVLLAGLLFGSRLGALTLLVYLAEGLVGLPVFAFGLGGPAAFLGPTGGYLVGFVFAAAVAGWLAEHGWDRRRHTTFLAMLIGNLVIYLFGVAWLSHLLPLRDALVQGVLPFLPGDLAKIAMAVAAVPASWTVLRRFGG